jgi:hypothetical protein
MNFPILTETFNTFCFDKQVLLPKLRRFFAGMPEYEDKKQEKKANDEFEELMKELETEK